MSGVFPAMVEDVSTWQNDAKIIWPADAHDAQATVFVLCEGRYYRTTVSAFWRDYLAIRGEIPDEARRPNDKREAVQLLVAARTKDEPLRYLGLEPIIERTLYIHGYRRISEVQTARDEYLSDLKGIGPTRVQQLRQAITRWNERVAAIPEEVEE